MAKSSSSSYVAPVDAKVQRLDQGIDYQGTPGTPVVAIGLARVDAVKDDPGGFGKVVYYTLLSGPERGQQIYVGHAAPAVHSGQIVQAGAPVAVLQQRSGGNAAGLPGWTEIGFAKGGVPESQSVSDTGAAKRFQAFVNDLSAAPAQPTSTSADTTTTDAGASAVPPVTVGQEFDMGVQPDPSSTQPLEPPPGSGIASTDGYVTDLWNRIASQPGVSPDTLALAQNAQFTGG